jgi:hypothetical protein
MLRRPFRRAKVKDRAKVKAAAIVVDEAVAVAAAKVARTKAVRTKAVSRAARPARSTRRSRRRHLKPPATRAWSVAERTSDVAAVSVAPVPKVAT